jgi:hypothetical protein
MAGYAFLPDEVAQLSVIMTAALNDREGVRCLIPLHVMAQRLFHEAHCSGFGDLERLKAVALGDEPASTTGPSERRPCSRSKPTAAP